MNHLDKSGVSYIGDNGSEISTPEDVRALLADPLRHWKKGASAFELAVKWLSFQKGFPDTVQATLNTCQEFQGAKLIEAYFEKKVDLGTPGRASQNDILAFADITNGKLVLAVEGKVKEPFGPLVRDKGKTPGERVRLNDLCQRLELKVNESGKLRYQLLHRTVSALLEAERHGCSYALMLVHSFCMHDTSFEDYRRFADALGISDAKLNSVVGFKQFDNIKLFLGWVKDKPSEAEIDQKQENYIMRRHEMPEHRNCDDASINEMAKIIKGMMDPSAPNKSSSSISSNISTEFKKQTGGEDYKEYYSNAKGLRSKISEIGWKYGVPVKDIGDLVVKMKGWSTAVKERTIDQILDV